jgi:hypothetical protein
MAAPDAEPTGLIVNALTSVSLTPLGRVDNLRTSRPSKTR